MSLGASGLDAWSTTLRDSNSSSMDSYPVSQSESASSEIVEHDPVKEPWSEYIDSSSEEES